MAHRCPPLCRATASAISVLVPSVPGTLLPPPPLQATHLWRAKASCLAWRWQRRRRRASRANHSSEPAAAMTAGCRRARTTPVLPAVTSARAWLMSPLCHCCVLPPHAPSWSPSPTQDTAGGIAGDPQPRAVECGHLDAVSGPGDRQGDLQAVGASVHCPVGGVRPALAQTPDLVWGPIGGDPALPH